MMQWKRHKDDGDGQINHWIRPGLNIFWVKRRSSVFSLLFVSDTPDVVCLLYLMMLLLKTVSSMQVNCTTIWSDRVSLKREGERERDAERESTAGFSQE